MSRWWSDLADDELEARLVNRGLPAGIAEAVTAERDDKPELIDQLLKEG